MLEAFSRAWTVTVSAVAMLLLAHALAAVWDTSVYIRGLPMALQQDQITTAL